MLSSSGGHRASADHVPPLVLRLLTRVAHPPATVLVLAAPGTARALDARGYRVVEAASPAGADFDLACESGQYGTLEGGARSDYAAGLAAAVRPGGRVFGVFPEAPSVSDLIHRFADAFDVEHLEPAGDGTLAVVLRRR